MGFENGYQDGDSVTLKLLYEHQYTLCKFKTLEFTEDDNICIGIGRPTGVSFGFLTTIMPEKNHSSYLDETYSVVIVKQVGEDTLYKIASEILISDPNGDPIRLRDFTSIGEIMFLGKCFSPWLPYNCVSPVWSWNGQEVGQVKSLTLLFKSFQLNAKSISGFMTVKDYNFGNFVCIGDIDIKYSMDFGYLHLENVVLRKIDTDEQIVYSRQIQKNETYNFTANLLLAESE